MRVIINRRQLIGIGSAALLTGAAGRAAAGDQVYESAYNYIIVSRSGSIVTLRQMETSGAQSAIDLDRPTWQVLPYTRWLFAAALVRSQPSAVLQLGLGAGAFNRLFAAGFAQSALTTVEIDPMMLKIAREETGFATAAQNPVVIDDARLYLRRSIDAWDWIILDAYVRNSQIPPHLTTLEFFKIVAARLRPGGAFVVNIAGSDPLFYALFNTLRQVFANNAAFAVPATGNRIFLGAAAAKPEIAGAVGRGPVDLAPATVTLLAQNGVDFAAMEKSLIAPAVPLGTPVLSDDFAPSEYLGSVWGRQH